MKAALAGAFRVPSAARVPGGSPGLSPVMVHALRPESAPRDSVMPPGSCTL